MHIDQEVRIAGGFGGLVCFPQPCVIVVVVIRDTLKGEYVDESTLRSR